MTIFLRILLSSSITAICIFIVIFSAGGGHGTFVPLKVLFPYCAILGIIQHKISWLAITIALIQFPVYSFLMNNKSKRKYLVPILHILAIIIAFNINDQIYS